MNEKQTLTQLKLAYKADLELLEKVYSELGNDADFENVKSLEGTAEEKSEKLTALQAKVDAEQHEIAIKDATLEAAKKNKQRLDNAKKEKPFEPSGAILDEKGEHIYATPRKRKTLLAFQDDPKDSNLTAEKKALGIYKLIHASKGDSNALQYCADNGIDTKVQNESQNSTGGVFVPDMYLWDVVRLFEQFGVARNVCQTYTMNSETLKVPQQTGEGAVYAVDEGITATTADIAYAQIGLNAKTFAAANMISKQLNDDAAISVIDIWVRESIRLLAKKEDDCFLNGDGTSTYHGMMGILTNIAAGTNGFQYFTSSHSTWATYDAADLEAVVGLLPQYADTADACWIMSRKFWSQVALRLIFAQGGSTGRELLEGFRKNQMFMGYPVVISQVMPTTTSSASGQISCVLGDWKQGAKFGDRQQYVIATSDSANSAFFNLQLALLMYERFDIQSKFAVGDSTHSGAYVGLKMA